MEMKLEECLSQLTNELESNREIAVRCLEKYASSNADVKAILISVFKNDSSNLVVNAAVTVLGRICRGTNEEGIARIFADTVADESMPKSTRRRAYIAIQQVLETDRKGGFKSIEELNARAQQVLTQVNYIYEFNVESDVDWDIIRRYAS